MKAGFIGLGNLGSAIAKRLITQGVELTVWNKTREKAEALGVKIADNPADLVAQSDIIFLNLFDSNAVRSVISGPCGMIEGAMRGKIIIDTSTNHHETVIEFHETIKSRGGSYLECPVLGSIIPAGQGALTVLISGERPTYETASPFIEKIGKTVFFLETPGLATKIKLINNLVLGVFMVGIGEAVSLAEKVGLNKDKILDILSAGAGNSAVLTAKKEKLLKEDFSAHFSSALIYKDLHYLQDMANALKKPLLAGGLTKEIFAMTFGKNMHEQDFAAVYKVFKEM